MVPATHNGGVRPETGLQLRWDCGIVLEPTNKLPRDSRDAANLMMVNTIRSRFKYVYLVKEAVKTCYITFYITYTAVQMPIKRTSSVHVYTIQDQLFQDIFQAFYN